MSGFGVQPCGTTAAGFGTQLEGPEPPEGPAGSRFIDPVTGDYALNPVTGQFKQMPPLRQRVLLTLLTRKGSSTVLPDFGTKLPKKMGTSFEIEVANSVRLALSGMSDVERSIRIDNILVERGAGGRARITVSYQDLSTGQTDVASIG